MFIVDLEPGVEIRRYAQIRTNPNFRTRLPSIRCGSPTNSVSSPVNRLERSLCGDTRHEALFGLGLTFSECSMLMQVRSRTKLHGQPALRDGRFVKAR